MRGGLLLLLGACRSTAAPPEEAARPLPTAPAAHVELELGGEAAPSPAEEVADERTAIGRVLAASAEQAGACYREAVLRDPDLWGEVMLRIAIGPEGAVRSVELRYATLRDPALQRCLVEVVGGLRFPAPGREIVVGYPFVFTSDRTPPEVRRALLLRHGLVREPEPGLAGEDEEAARDRPTSGPTEEGWWETW